MDIPRKIGTAIVMIVPSFVGGGALWALFHCWAVVVIWILIMMGLTGSIVTGKLSKFSRT
ncbi:MAG: hypothetical protein JW821_08930 [Deltaproteobacteria bacterium]|nr:hypothetical protein [Deltaproteobacteria bacterium]